MEAENASLYVLFGVEEMDGAVSEPSSTPGSGERMFSMRSWEAIVTAGGGIWHQQIPGLPFIAVSFFPPPQGFSLFLFLWIRVRPWECVWCV